MKTSKELLPPINPIEPKPEGSSKEALNQKKLKEFYELQEQYYDIRDRYIARYRQLQELILRGATIQNGEYKVSSGVRLVRRPSYKQIVIDLKGEAYQQRLLENTPPHAHFRVIVR